MKVTGNNYSYNNALKNYAKVDKATKATGVRKIQDKIEISDTAREVQVATKAFKELPDVRQDLVNRLKTAIKEGTYKPSAEEVAKKMISLSRKE